MSDHATTIIKPSALFSHSRILSPIPSQSQTQHTMLNTPPYTYQSMNQPFFHSPNHNFVLPYVATAPPLALDESAEEEWLNDYDGSKTPDFMDENNMSNPSTPYFVESDLSTISDDRSVDQHYEEQLMDNGEMFDSNSVVSRSHFPAPSSIFEEPQPIIQSIRQSIDSYSIPLDLPRLEAVPESPVLAPAKPAPQSNSKSVIVSLKSSSKQSSKSSKSSSKKISSSQSVIDYPSNMSRSLAIVKGTRSYGDLQSLKQSKKSSKVWSKSHKPSSKSSSSKGTPRQASGEGQSQQQQQQTNQQSAADTNQSTQSTNQSNGQPAGEQKKSSKSSKRSSGGKRKRSENSSSDEGSDHGSSSSDDHSGTSSSEEEVDENGKKVKKDKSKSKKKLKTLSKRERNKLSAKAYRQRKKTATCQLSDKNAALQRIVDQQSRMLADSQLESARMREQMGVLQTLLSIKVSDLWQSRPVPEGGAESVAQSSPLAPSPMPALPSFNSSGMLTVHSPEPSDSSLVGSFTNQSGERSALALREGEDLKQGVLNQRTGMFLLALFSCFLLFNPGHRRAVSHGHGEEPGTPVSADAGVLNTLAEAAIKSETDTSPNARPTANIKNEPLSHEQMAAFLAASGSALDPSLIDPTVRIPLVSDAQSLLHEWLVTADENAMAQLRALTYEPLMRAMGQENANRAIREFAASFARQLQ